MPQKKLEGKREERRPPKKETPSQLERGKENVKERKEKKGGSSLVFDRTTKKKRLYSNCLRLEEKKSVEKEKSRYGREFGKTAWLHLP